MKKSSIILFFLLEIADKKLWMTERKLMADGPVSLDRRAKYKFRKIYFLWKKCRILKKVL